MHKQITDLSSGQSIIGTGNLVIAAGGIVGTHAGNQEIAIEMGGNITVENTGVIEANVTSLIAVDGIWCLWWYRYCHGWRG